MVRNEHGDDIPEWIFHEIKVKIENELGLQTIPNFRSYVYLDQKYGKGYGRKYEKDYPSSITGKITGNKKGTRFRSKPSYEANKVYIDDEKRYVVFLSPTYGGVNIFDDWIPYRHR